MRRSRAFILTELLTGMMLQAGFLLVLCTSFYMMLSFYTRTQQVLSARDKGERVIAYFDQRIRHAGLGFGKCTSSADVRNALWPIASLTASPKKVLSNKDLALPVAVTYLNQDNFDDNDFNSASSNIITNSLGHQAYCGNILTLIYAERENSQNFYVIVSQDPSITITGPSKVRNETRKGYNYKLLNYDTTISSADVKSTALTATYPYLIAPSVGLPFRIRNYYHNDRVEYSKDNYPDTQIQRMSFLSLDISPVVNLADELHYLKCKRLFVEGIGVNSNFKYQNLTSKWGNQIPHEKGILEIYMELDTVTKIFDLYVLSTGGEDKSVTRSKPTNWPDNARWKNEYLNHALYVSHASWKLHNLENIRL